MTELVVARIGRAHGLKGEVSVELRTDAPDRRLYPGAVLVTDPTSAGPLTVDTVRDHNGTIMLTFTQAPGREAAEGLRGVLLIADVDEDQDAEPDAWFDHQLVGLRARTVDGVAVGTVAAVHHLPAQDLLVVRREGRPDVLVPFVQQIVPTVDVAAGELVIDPPGGLLDDIPGTTDGNG